MTKMTRDDFFEAIEMDGFEGLALHSGPIEIEGHVELTNAFKEFVEFLDILGDHYDMWNETTERAE